MNNQYLLQLLGKTLKQIREAHGLSVNELAQMSRVNKSTIYGIEQGKVNTRLSTIEKFSIAMKHPAIDFFKF